MNDDELRDLLHDARDRIPVRPAPMPRLLGGGRRLERRRHRLRVGATVVAVAGVLGAGFLLVPTSGSGPSRDVPVATPAPPDTDDAHGAPEAPVAPEGMRLVGMGRVVVAVPDSWTTNDVRCGAPLSDTVEFRSEIVDACLIQPAPEVTVLRIVDMSSTWAQPWLDLDGSMPPGRTETIDGVEVETYTYSGRIGGAIVVRSEDVVMTIHGPEIEVVDEVLESVRILPEGYTTVPANPNDPPSAYPALIEAADLAVELVRRPGGRPGRLLEVRPDVGSVVPIGSTVTLVLSGSSARRQS